MNNRKSNTRMVSKFNELEKFQYKVLEWHYHIIHINLRKTPEIRYYDRFCNDGYRPSIINFGSLSNLELMHILIKRGIKNENNVLISESLSKIQ